jgi:osmotically-inducible protein OsmY
VHSEDELTEAVKVAQSLPDVKDVKNELNVVSFKRYKE